MLDEAKLSNLTTLVRETSLTRLKICSKHEDISIQANEQNRAVNGYWMSIILLSGGDLRLTLKVFFASHEIAVLAASVFGKSPNEITKEQCADFVKEFCNLTAGSVKTSLEEKGIQVGLSLPLVTRGFDDIFFPTGSSASDYCDLWQLSSLEVNLKCMAIYNVYNSKILENIQFKMPEYQVENTGDVDFL
jgi:CheY-specific phosphatase CheX